MESHSTESSELDSFNLFRWAEAWEIKRSWFTGARVKRYKSKDYNQSMIATLQLVFHITCYLAKLSFQPSYVKYITIFMYMFWKINNSDLWERSKNCFSFCELFGLMTLYSGSGKCVALKMVKYSSCILLKHK
jgi:hypothetical protein